MTRTALPPSPMHRASRGVLDQLATALADLRQLGLHAQVLTEPLLGGDDVRLRVWADDADVTVELLWCWPDDSPPEQLSAVRVTSEARTIWCHPHGRCIPADIARFVSDLLLLDEAALMQHYCMLS